MRQGYARRYVSRMDPEDRRRLNALLDWGLRHDKDPRTWCDRLTAHWQRRVATFQDAQAGRILADMCSDGLRFALRLRHRHQYDNRVRDITTGAVYDLNQSASVTRRDQNGVPTGERQLSYWARLTQPEWNEWSAERREHIAGEKRSEKAMDAVDDAWVFAAGRALTVLDACDLAGLDLDALALDLG